MWVRERMAYEYGDPLVNRCREDRGSGTKSVHVALGSRKELYRRVTVEPKPNTEGRLPLMTPTKVYPWFEPEG